jgi:hypothetical protein
MRAARPNLGRPRRLILEGTPIFADQYPVTIGTPQLNFHTRLVVTVCT